MASMNSQKIEQPASRATSIPGMQARIFTMPEQYRHGVEWKMHEPSAKTPAIAPVEVRTPTLPAPKAPSKPTGPKKKMSTTKKIIVVGVAILILLAAIGYLLVYFTPVPSPQMPPPTTQTTIRPAPVVEEEPEPAPEPEEEEATALTNPFPTATVPGVDTDSDGLTDIEEDLVYDTNPKLPDTDADGFLDGNEVFHGYNPGGKAPGTLLESGVVSEYQGSTVEDEYQSYSYVLLYPSAWEIESAMDQLLPTPVTILATTGEKIQVTLVKTDMPFVDPLAWYEAQGYTQDVEEMTTKNDHRPALISEDRLTVYIFSADLVVILTMDTGIKSTISYLQTFQMILNSVEIL